MNCPAKKSVEERRKENERQLVHETGNVFFGRRDDSGDVRSSL
jgi:hypothetical protein